MRYTETCHVVTTGACWRCQPWRSVVLPTPQQLPGPAGAASAAQAAWTTCVAVREAWAHHGAHQSLLTYAYSYRYLEFLVPSLKNTAARSLNHEHRNNLHIRCDLRNGLHGMPLQGMPPWDAALSSIDSSHLAPEVPSPITASGRPNIAREGVR